MKKKLLLSSIATIAVCLSLIAGSTFAIFTSNSQVNIAINAANVEMKADVTDVTCYSVRPATVPEKNAEERGEITLIEDQSGGKYVYADPSDTFANGGTADFTNGTLTLKYITPGDKVSFNVKGYNSSNVTVQYRYIIECTDGKTLMSALRVSINGTTYDYLGAYTSGWATLAANTDMATVPVVIEFPVNADDDYQNETTAISVKVEAVQGNADVAGSTKPVIEFLSGVSIDMEGKYMPLQSGVVNNGTLELSNGEIAINQTAFDNNGEATLTDIVINGGTSGVIAYGYAVRGHAGSTTVLNNVAVNTANGGISAADGAKVVFESGSVVINSANTSQRYNIYAVGEGTVVEINGGTFAFEEYRQRSYAYAGAGATVYIKGGTFGKAPNHTRWKHPIYEGGGEVIISGGVFGFDPTEWLADGYQAVKNGTQWYVVAENVNEVVANKDQLVTALANATGDYVINVVGAIEGDVTVTAKAGVNVTINGNGNTFAGVLTVDGKSGTIMTAGLTVNNFVFQADTISADACIRLGTGGATTNSTRYVCNLTVNDCYFDVAGAVAVKSYTGGDKNLTISNCYVTENCHSLAQLTGVDGVVIDNCEVYATRGASLNNSDNVVVKNSTFNVKKYALRFGSGAFSATSLVVDGCELTSECQEGDAVVILRAGAVSANFSITNTTVEGPIPTEGFTL